LATRFTIEDEQFGQTFPLLSDFSMDGTGDGFGSGESLAVK
jgi:hypothetical protein